MVLQARFAVNFMLVALVSWAGANAYADANVACARVALRDRIAHDLERLRKAASPEPIMTQVVEAEIAPSIAALAAKIPSDVGPSCGDATTGRSMASAESRSPASNASASLAPEWNEYGELFFQARLKWREAATRLPAMRVAKSQDEEVFCRVKRSIASTDGVLARFQAGCAQNPKLGACRKPSATSGLLKQRQELESQLEANRRRFGAKWGKALLDQLACR